MKKIKMSKSKRFVIKTMEDLGVESGYYDDVLNKWIYTWCVYDKLKDEFPVDDMIWQGEGARTMAKDYADYLNMTVETKLEM